MTEQYTKKQKLASIEMIRHLMPNQETVLEPGCDEELMVIGQIDVEGIEPVESDVFNSGVGSGCGGFNSYMINGVRYDMVVPDVVEPDKYAIIRYDPIDWDAKIREVEQSE